MRKSFVGFRVSQQERRRLDKAAKKMGIPLSDLVRRLLWLALEVDLTVKAGQTREG